MRKHPSLQHVGIMACETEGAVPFSETTFYRRLCRIGYQNGLTVFIFSPLQIDWTTQTVEGYTFGSGCWTKRSFPLPQLVYDRCFYTNKEQQFVYRRAIGEMRKRGIPFLGCGLKGKAEVYRALVANTELSGRLPATERYTGPNALLAWLKRRGSVFLKPNGGSHGKGAIHIAKINDERYEIRGRDSRNGIIRLQFDEAKSMLAWVRRFIGNRNYLVQQYLLLCNRQGEPFDIRALVQKNEKGEWQMTGMAVRIGDATSVTSNLHGGGRAERVEPFLTAEFGGSAKEILSTLHQLASAVPRQLEASHGRLAELGLDFGIDQSGNVWFLEANSKPGRAVFDYTDNEAARKQSIENPIRFARFLLDRPGKPVGG